MELILANPLIAILAGIVTALVGKYLFMGKDRETQISKDIQSTEVLLKEDLHKFELSITEKLGMQAEKMRVIQKETLDEANKKFFTKEMAKEHNERISKLEAIIAEILPRMEKLDVMYEIVTSKHDNKNK